MTSRKHKRKAATAPAQQRIRGRHVRPEVEEESDGLQRLREKYPAVVTAEGWEEHCLYPVIYDAERAVSNARAKRAEDDPECARWLREALHDLARAEKPGKVRMRMRWALAAAQKAGVAAYCAHRRGAAARVVGRPLLHPPPVPLSAPQHGEWPRDLLAEYAYRGLEWVDATTPAGARAMATFLTGRMGRATLERWAEVEWHRRLRMRGRRGQERAARESP